MLLLAAWVSCIAAVQDGVPKENDEINVVWVVDSDQLPFYRAGAPWQTPLLSGVCGFLKDTTASTLL
jgi:hypothetical protein